MKVWIFQSATGDQGCYYYYWMCPNCKNVAFMIDTVYLCYIKDVSYYECETCKSTKFKILLTSDNRFPFRDIEEEKFEENYKKEYELIVEFSKQRRENGNKLHFGIDDFYEYECDNIVSM